LSGYSKTARTRPPGQNNQVRTTMTVRRAAGTGQPRHGNRGRTAGKNSQGRKKGQDSHSITQWTGQPGQENHCRTAGIEQKLGRDIRNRIAGTGQP
jgi:hypothetical protein